ncbi:MAG: HipA domain-containing protein [Pirellulales bacterium]|nr:HipA domain-containing protein [Pirellulales bacterium]
MSRVCRICLGNLADDGDYHPRCLRALFGTTKVPTLDLETSKLHTAALAMVGHTSLSGIQKKISVSLSADRATLQVAASGGRYVLKPQTGTYPALPENEHLTTQLAKLVDIEVAPNGLVSLKDGTRAYIVRRFDRLPDGHKLRQEDFCQLAQLPPKDKYDGGSAELCVKLIRKYADEPLVELLKLYRLLLFTWWTGNGDMHLKNFSLLTGEDGITRLTPAYDLVCTRLVIPDDQLALPLQGKKDDLRRGVWRRFAEYCGLPEKVALRLLDKQASILNDATALIDRSFLPDDQKESYKRLIDDRSDSVS